MEKVLLQKGDIIRFAEGIRVTASIPKKYVSDYALRGELTEVSITIGEIFEKNPTGVDKALETIANFVKTSTFFKESRKKKILWIRRNLCPPYFPRMQHPQVKKMTAR